jgi:hypothetical protein
MQYVYATYTNRKFHLTLLGMHKIKYFNINIWLPQKINPLQKTVVTHGH